MIYRWYKIVKVWRSSTWLSFSCRLSVTITNMKVCDYATCVFIILYLGIFLSLFETCLVLGLIYPWLIYCIFIWVVLWVRGSLGIFACENKNLNQQRQQLHHLSIHILTHTDKHVLTCSNIIQWSPSPVYKKENNSTCVSTHLHTHTHTCSHINNPWLEIHACIPNQHMHSVTHTHGGCGIQ